MLQEMFRGGGKGRQLTRGRPAPLVDGSPPAAHSPACASRAAAQTFHQRTKKENATKKNRERRKAENAQGSDKEEQGDEGLPSGRC